MAGGGDVVPVSPRAEQPAAKKRAAAGRRQQAQAAAACLPLDVIVEEIAARSDAATLVRCAATCRDARRRIAEDPDLRARLRLRGTSWFLLPLMRGHLAGITTYEGGGRGKNTVYLVDTTAADTTRLVKATFAETDETLRDAVPVDSRGGLVLLRATATTSPALPWQRQQHDHQLVVCDPATRRRQDLPPEPAFPPRGGQSTDVQYVLLVGGDSDGDGDGEGGATVVGRPFQVLKAKLMLSKRNRYYRRLMVHIFSSEHGAWCPLTETPAPNIHGSYICWASRRKVLLVVVGDVVHWLCLTDVGSYVLMFHVRAAAARVSETALPASFPRGDAPGTRSYLLATDSAGGSPVVLVADDESIRAWEQCKRTTKSKKMWKARPQVVIEREAILGFNDDMVKIFGREEEGTRSMFGPELLWFGERSGAVLLQVHGFCLLWLDLHSKKIVRCFSSDRRMQYAQVYCPYEVHLSSWVPTFSSAAVTI